MSFGTENKRFSGVTASEWRKEMLKLTIKPGDSVKIDDDVTVTVTQSTYNRIQLEIEAPPDVLIRREKREAPKTPVIIVKGNRMM